VNGKKFILSAEAIEKES